MFAEPRYVDTAQRPAGASGSPRFGAQTGSDVNLQLYAERIQSSLQDLLDVIAKYSEESGDYFTDQNTNGHRTLEELKTNMDSFKGHVSEYSINKLAELNGRARTIASEVQAKIRNVDDKHRVSDSFRKALDDVRSKTASVYADVSHNLRSAKRSLASKMDSAKDKVEGAKDAVEPGPLTSAKKQQAKEGMKDDVRNTVTSLLNAMEDIMHQLTESTKQRKDQVTEAVASAKEVTQEKASQAYDAALAAKDKVQEKSSEAYESAQKRAADVMNQLRQALSWIVNLPPMTMEELQKLAEENEAAESERAPLIAGAEPSEAEMQRTTRRKWLSTLASGLLIAIDNTKAAVIALADALGHPVETKDRMTTAIVETKDHVVTVADNASTRVRETFSTLGNKATDATIRGVLAVDRTLHVSSGVAVVDEKFGIREKASAAARSLDERYGIAERYANALSQLDAFDNKYVLGLGHKLVAAGTAVAESGKEYIGDRIHHVKGDASPTDLGYEQFDSDTSPSMAAGLSSREKRNRIAAQRNAVSCMNAAGNPLPGGTSAGFAGATSRQGLKGQHAPPASDRHHGEEDSGSFERQEFHAHQGQAKPLKPSDHSGALTGASTGSTFKEAQKHGLTSGNQAGGDKSESGSGTTGKHDDFPPLSAGSKQTLHQQSQHMQSNVSKADSDLKGVFFKGVDVKGSDSSSKGEDSWKPYDSPAGTFESHRTVPAPTKFDMPETGGSQFSASDSSKESSHQRDRHAVGSSVDSLESSVPSSGFGGSAASTNNNLKKDQRTKGEPSHSSSADTKPSFQSGWRDTTHHGATTGMASATGQSTTAGTSNFNPAGTRIPDFSHRKGVGSTFGAEQSLFGSSGSSGGQSKPSDSFSQQPHHGSDKSAIGGHASSIQTSKTGDELPAPGQQMELEEFMKRGAGPSGVKPERLEGIHPPARNYGQGSIDGPTTFGLAPGSASGGSIFGAHDSGTKSSGFGSLGSLGKNPGASSGGNGQYNPAAGAAYEGPMHTNPLMNATTAGDTSSFAPSKSLHEDTAQSGASGSKDRRQGSEAKEVKPY